MTQRAHHSVVEHPSSTDEPPIVVDRTSIDLRYGQVTHADGSTIVLNDVERRLLSLLYLHAGTILTRRRLAIALRPERPMCSASVNTIVHRLRLKLDRAASLVATVLGAGYRMEPSVLAAPRVDRELDLIDRDAELATLAAARAPGARWLVGPGGVGKTALLRAHASMVRARGAELVWVDLRPAEGGPWRGVERTLGLPASLAEPGSDLGPRALRELATRPRTLLVIDAAEHATHGLTAALASLRPARGAAVLVASRVAPPHGDVTPLRPLGPAAGRALFLRRLAQARLGRGVRADELAAAHAIADTLGGLPLALELAACHAGWSSLAAARAQVDDPWALPEVEHGPFEPHHRSLRRVLDACLALLAPAERSALRLLVGATRARRLGRAPLHGVPATIVSRLSTMGWLEPRAHGADVRIVEPMRRYLLARFGALGPGAHGPNTTGDGEGTIVI